MNMLKIGIQLTQSHCNAFELLYFSSVVVITGTGFGLKVVFSSPASVDFSFLSKSP